MLVRQVCLATPVGIDGDGGGESLGGGWCDPGEEVASEPRYLVLRHRDVKFTFMLHVVGRIVGGHLQMDDAFRLVQEGV